MSCGRTGGGCLDLFYGGFDDDFHQVAHAIYALMVSVFEVVICE